MNNAAPASSQSATPAPAAQQPRRFAATFKLLFVGVLALLLLIPLAMVKSLLSERRARRTEAITDITGTWGGSQTLTGPVRGTAVIGLELTVIYGFLFITLQLQDYALVFGSAGLFAALAIVMFATRRVNRHEAH
mgnify:CR=1 FL=1